MQNIPRAGQNEARQIDSNALDNQVYYASMKPIESDTEDTGEGVGLFS